MVKHCKIHGVSVEQLASKRERVGNARLLSHDVQNGISYDFDFVPL